MFAKKNKAEIDVIKYGSKSRLHLFLITWIYKTELGKKIKFDLKKNEKQSSHSSFFLAKIPFV